MPTAFLSNIDPIAPKALLDQAKAAATPRVAIAAADARLPMEAAKEATQAGLMTPLFAGDMARIMELAEELDWDISAYNILDADGEEEAGFAAAAACGTGSADVLMKGHLHTDNFMKAALNREAGLRTGSRLVHIFYMTPPNSDRALMISDAAVNVSPNLETRKAAIEHCIVLARKTGVTRPRIAILSATETPIPTVPSSQEAHELADWAQGRFSDADIAGPLAMDLILSAKAAKTKDIATPVAGNADAVIVPDIVSGNALFKTLVYTCGGCAAGIVMGAKVPILLTSRADPKAARLASVALAAVATS